FPDGNPGSGLYLGAAKNGVRYAVLNLQGRVFMTPIDCPFRTADRELERIPSGVSVVIVDIHAEASSEKMAMGWYLDGRVTAVIGTHTHVPTADEQILPGGTAFISDVGMTGPYDSILGRLIEGVLSRAVKSVPSACYVGRDDSRDGGHVADIDVASS